MAVTEERSERDRIGEGLTVGREDAERVADALQHKAVADTKRLIRRRRELVVTAVSETLIELAEARIELPW